METMEKLSLLIDELIHHAEIIGFEAIKQGF